MSAAFLPFNNAFGSLLLSQEKSKAWLPFPTSQEPCVTPGLISDLTLEPLIWAPWTGSAALASPCLHLSAEKFWYPQVFQGLL